MMVIQRSVDRVLEDQEKLNSTDILSAFFTYGTLIVDSYVERFPAQIALEKSPWLYVENYMGFGKEPSRTSAERLIGSWEWYGKIKETLERFMEERVHNPLRTVAGVLSSAEIAKMILESIKAICSQGQNLVPITVFQYDLVAPILRKAHAKFAERLGVDETAMWSPVFADYVALFDDEEVSRLHTHREWWIKCCRRAGIRPTHQVRLVICECHVHFLSRYLSDRQHITLLFIFIIH
ncbi:hypothetical protein NECAME_12877 [Necator americanus]|uniref:Uncharacterized protein n=1 Tax=Necator americanus TaxID=51031 RepID=W2T0T7_NECAM|nr:hypothetical protein NECAME_12877 [Necator americanus]ETN74587.1 hypothetical protein NECAME_12877 [Necator americanus]